MTTPKPSSTDSSKKRHELVPVAYFVCAVLSNLRNRPLSFHTQRLDLEWFEETWNTSYKAPENVLSFAKHAAYNAEALWVGLYLLCKLPIGFTEAGLSKKALGGDQCVELDAAIWKQGDPTMSLFTLALRLGEISAFDNDQPHMRWPFPQGPERNRYFELETKALICLGYNLGLEHNKWRAFLTSARTAALNCSAFDDKKKYYIQRSITRFVSLPVKGSPGWEIVDIPEGHEASTDDKMDLADNFVLVDQPVTSIVESSSEATPQPHVPPALTLSSLSQKDPAEDSYDQGASSDWEMLPELTAKRRDSFSDDMLSVGYPKGFGFDCEDDDEYFRKRVGFYERGVAY